MIGFRRPIKQVREARLGFDIPMRVGETYSEAAWRLAHDGLVGGTALAISFGFKKREIKSKIEQAGPLLEAYRRNQEIAPEVSSMFAIQRQNGIKALTQIIEREQK